MQYNFKCLNEKCEHSKEEQEYALTCTIAEYDALPRTKDKTATLECPKCGGVMLRIYKDFRIRKFKGKITPKEVRTADGQVHRMNDNLWR